MKPLLASADTCMLAHTQAHMNLKNNNKIKSSHKGEISEIHLSKSTLSVFLPEKILSYF